jgi:hypothetical protein
MKIEFQLDGDGELPPITEFEVLPAMGTAIEYHNTKYIIQEIRFLIADGKSKILLVIKHF